MIVPRVITLAQIKVVLLPTGKIISPLLPKVDRTPTERTMLLEA
jgi:hypothetical protein